MLKVKATHKWHTFGRKKKNVESKKYQKKKISKVLLMQLQFIISPALRK
jgi:hypothetical protein